MKAELVLLRVSDLPTSQAHSLWAIENGCDKSSWLCWKHMHLYQCCVGIGMVGWCHNIDSHRSCVRNSCGWIWSRSFHSRIVCSRNNTSKSLMLISKGLMIAEACSSVPGILWRADKTSKCPTSFFDETALNQLHWSCWSCSARQCRLSKGCSRSEQHSWTSRRIGAADLSLLVGNVVCLLQDASGHSNVLKAGKAEDLKNARKMRTARKAN